MGEGDKHPDNAVIAGLPRPAPAPDKALGDARRRDVVQGTLWLPWPQKPRAGPEGDQAAEDYPANRFDPTLVSLDYDSIFIVAHNHNVRRRPAEQLAAYGPKPRRPLSR